MSNVKIVNDDFRNQILPKRPEIVDPQNIQCIVDNDCKDKINPEDYIQHEIDAQTEEYNRLTSLEDLFPFVIIDVNDYTFELVCELKNRLDLAKTESHQTDNSATIQKYEKWIGILNYIDGFMTPQELDALAECIGTYASVCGPYERRKEICRNLCYQNSCFDIDLLELDRKIYRVDLQVLYELTEVLLELETLFFCTTNSDKSLHSSTDKRDWPISTFYYCWEVLEFDNIQWYEMDYEISLVQAGLVNDIWSAEPDVCFIDEYTMENDYYNTQNFGYHEDFPEMIDIEDLDCLSEDDLFKETWLVAGMKLQNHIDYFWEAEITELCFASNSWHSEYKDYCSEDEYDNYSKYKCHKEDSGFNYCDKDSCQVYSLFGRKRVLNEQYVLWKKFVQPIELDEYYGTKAS